MSDLKLGLLPPRPERPRIEFKELFPRGLPKPPASFDATQGIKDWGMLGNSTAGDCVAEGTLVEGPGVRKALRGPYSGPMVTMTFASGKVLTVTPNHAVMTPRGFVRARFLQKGDYALGTTGAKPREVAIHFDHHPSPVEEVFAAFERRRLRTHAARTDVMATVHLHGDERFLNGNVDVEDAHGFLQRELHASLGQPNGKSKVGVRGKTERALHSLGSTFKRSDASRSATLGSVGVAGYGLALGEGHGRVPKSERLGLRANRPTALDQQVSEPARVDPGLACEVNVGRHASVIAPKQRLQVKRGVALSSMFGHQRSARPEVKASRDYPSAEGGRTDSELSRYLVDAAPGFIQADRLVDINLHSWTGHIYDLSTSTRWYVANGIISHNCVVAEYLHQCMVYETIATGKTPTFTDAEALTLYTQLTGWDPSKPDSDTGLNSEDFLTLATQRTLLGQRLKTFAPVHIKSVEHLKIAIWLFDGLNTGAVLPGDAEEQFSAGKRWEINGFQQPLGGHAIPALKYDEDGPVYVTWGAEQPATWDWTMQTLMTADVLIPTEFSALHKALDNGYDPRELDAFLGHV